MMFVSVEIKLRPVFDKLLSVLIRIISFLPFKSTKSRIIDFLKKKQKKTKLMNLFDDNTYLTYVKKKKLGLEKNASIIETIALRGSNSDYGFFSPMWKNSYNLGLTSSDLFISYHLYQNLRAKLHNLKYVIFFLNIPAPGNSLIFTSERYRAVAYKYFFNIPYAEEGMIKTRFEKYIIKKCNNLTITEWSEDYAGYDKKTYYGTNLSMKDRARTHLRENRREPNQLHWLKKLSEHINEDKRNLFVVIPPFRSDFKNELPPKSELFQKFYNLELKNTEFLDFYDSDLFTDADMGDTDHLNEQGAIKLTTEIRNYFNERGYL